MSTICTLTYSRRQSRFPEGRAKAECTSGHDGCTLRMNCQLFETDSDRHPSLEI